MSRLKEDFTDLVLRKDLKKGTKERQLSFKEEGPDAQIHVVREMRRSEREYNGQTLMTFMSGKLWTVNHVG